MNTFKIIPNDLRALLRGKAFQKYFILFCIKVLFFFFLFLWALSNANKHRNQLAKEIEAGQLLEEEKAFLDKIVKTDELVIVNGSYTKALKAYDALLETATPELRDAINARISQIKAILTEDEEEGVQHNPLELVIRQNRTLIATLYAQIDSLMSEQSTTVDSLRTKIADLSEGIAQREKDLSKKDRVKVISFIGNKGVKIHYLGEVIDGKANGGGVGIWATGSIYKGQWKDNLRHGQGTYEWADGEKYEGEYLEGRREGTGTYYWPSGERYKGDWKNDKRNGAGTLYDQDGNIRFEGNWEDDKPLK